MLRSGQKLDALEQLVSSRMERQAIMARDNPPRLWLLTSEAVIRYGVGSGAVMREQLKHLLAAAEQPNITLQVIPGDAGSHPGLEGSFTLLSFPGLAPDVAYIEGAGGHGILVEKSAEVSELAVLFDLIRAAALPERESVKLLTAVMESA